jgi:hypothetical protein
MRLEPSNMLGLLLAAKATAGGGLSSTFWRDRATAERFVLNILVSKVP